LNSQQELDWAHLWKWTFLSMIHIRLFLLARLSSQEHWGLESSLITLHVTRLDP
jgi:hypothetical protein